MAPNGFWLRLWLAVLLRWNVVRPAVWTLAWCLAIAYLLALQPQGQEVLLRLAEEQRLWPWLAFAVALGTLTLAVWYSGRSVLYVLYKPQLPMLEWCRKHAGDETYHRVSHRWRKWFPRALAPIPALASVFGLLLGIWDADETPTGAFSLLFLIIAVFILSLLGMALSRARIDKRMALSRAGTDERTVDRFTDDGIRKHHGRYGQQAHHLPRPTRRVILICLVLGVAVSVALGLPEQRWTANARVALLREVGTTAVVLFAAAFFVMFTTTVLAHLALKTRGVSLIGLVVLGLAWAGLLARTGLSDNHAVRQLTGHEAQEEWNRVLQRPTLQEYLAAWLDERVPGSGGPGSSRNQPLPLVVAAAQGGGIRAAMWTATTLGTLQDADPRFACSLFAIAGISGGAMGALSFVAQLPQDLGCTGEVADTPALAGAARARECEDGVQPPDTLACRATRVFGDDLLAPALGGFLFPDLAQRFFFLPVALDRQWYLETALEQSWKRERAAGMPGLDQGFLAVARPPLPQEPGRLPILNASRPALFLIASEVERGRRWIVSDIQVNKHVFGDAIDALTGQRLPEWEEKLPQCQSGEPCPHLLALPASAAAGLSARFPYVSPPGMVTLTVDKKPRTSHLLDGGIVDASGAGTAAEILLGIRRWCGDPEREREGVLACGLRKRSIPENDPRYGLVDPARYTKVGRECEPQEGECKSVYVHPAALQITNDAWAWEGDRTNPECLSTGRLPLPGWLEEWLKPKLNRLTDRCLRTQTATYFPELLDPIKGLLNSRTGRGRAAHDRLAADVFLMANQDNSHLELQLPRSDNAFDDENVPLGWVLRNATKKLMRNQAATELARDHATEWLCRVFGPPMDRPTIFAPLAVEATADRLVLPKDGEAADKISTRLATRDEEKEGRFSFCAPAKRMGNLAIHLSMEIKQAPGVTGAVRMRVGANEICYKLFGEKYLVGCQPVPNTVPSLELKKVSHDWVVGTITLALYRDRKGSGEEEAVLAPHELIFGPRHGGSLAATDRVMMDERVVRSAEVR